MHEGIKIQLQESLQSRCQVRPDARFHHFSWKIWWGQVCGASSRAMNLRRKGVNHLTHQEKQTSRWWWQWWRHEVQDESLCLLDEFLQLIERMERISSEALVTDDSPKFQCHVMWLNRGAKELFFFLTQTKGPEDGGVVLRRGAHQWDVETSSYLWVGGTSQTSRSDTKGRSSLPLLNVLQSA